MIKALVMDDESAVASIIKHFIDKENFPIEIVGEAKNGQEGLNMIKRYNPQLIFIDIQMPLLNGFEAIEKAPDYSYIIITAFDSFEYAQKALRIGAKDIIIKPIEFQQLKEAIERAIGWRFTDNNQVNEILEYLNNNYMNSVSLNDLADITHASTVYISRLFKEKMNVGIINYVHQLRIEHSLKLLESSNLSIKEIGYEVGYDSLNNFYKYFKRYINTTPANYIKNKHKEEG